MNRCATSSDRVATVRRLCDVRVTEHIGRLVGAGRAADRDFIDYRNNIVLPRRLQRAHQYSLSLLLHNSYA